jgi:hypothetical protein
MSQQTFLIICAVFIAIPFIVSCIKGNPLVGFIAGLASFLLMGFAASHGASMLEIHVVGFVLAGLGTAWALHGT